MIPLILRLDAAGQAINWMPWQEAALYYANDRVKWTLGEHRFLVHGGYNRAMGRQSTLEIASIVSTAGTLSENRHARIPPLTNRALFRRDHYTCMYCLTTLPEQALTRDHVVPLSRNGSNAWTNVVTACAPCNQRKGARTPEQARMKLLAVPYAPNYAEWLVLRNRRILADQMAFLKTQYRQQRRAY